MRTDRMNSVVLKQRSDHCVTNHDRRYLERLKLISSESGTSSVVIVNEVRNGGAYRDP